MAETEDKPQPEAVDAVNGADLTDAQVVALRSQDVTAEATTEHRKVFVLPPGPKPTEANGFDHSANKAATRQYAISQGLRPTSDDVRLISTKPFGPGDLSWALTYGVQCEPAESAAYPDPGGAYVVTDAIADDDGNVHTNTDKAGASGDTRPDDLTE
jgi:hypothetical protein